MSQRKRNHFRIPAENCVDAPLQISNPLAMNNPCLKNPALLASGQIFWNETANFFRLERVQIQNSIDSKLEWFGLVKFLSHHL